MFARAVCGLALAVGCAAPASAEDTGRSLEDLAEQMLTVESDAVVRALHGFERGYGRARWGRAQS